MQPTNSEKPTELTMWWPNPSALDDLTVTDAEHGWDLSAPDDTECAAWLAYWNQDEEHHKFFEQEFISILIEHANLTLNQHGENENLPVRGQTDPEQAEDECSGTEPEHESGSDS